MEANSSKKGLKYVHVTEPAREAIKYMDDRRKGLVKSLRTPWKKFNQVCMGGIEWHTITTIAGMSGSGKTAIINQLETGLFDLNPDENFAVLSLNFEMLAMKLVGRKISSKLGKSTIELYSADEGSPPLSDTDYNLAIEEAKKLIKYDIYYVEQSGTVAQIQATILSFALSQREVDPDKGLIVFLDHVLLVNGKAGELERQILFELMVMMNALKKPFKISFVLLSQLNRDIEDSERIQTPELQFPRKKDLFGGDSMYQFSDIVLIAHRPEMLGITAYGPHNWATRDLVYFHYLKVREGEPCIAAMQNMLKYNQVLDLPARS